MIACPKNIPRVCRTHLSFQPVKLVGTQGTRTSANRERNQLKGAQKSNRKNVCKQKKSKKLCSVSIFKTGQTAPAPTFQCFDPVIDLSTRESKEV